MESSAASFIQDPWECIMGGAERGGRGSNPFVQHSDYWLLLSHQIPLYRTISTLRMYINVCTPPQFRSGCAYHSATLTTRCCKIKSRRARVPCRTLCDPFQIYAAIYIDYPCPAQELSANDHSAKKNPNPLGSAHGHESTGNRVRDGATLIPVKAAQWSMKAQ